jgi:FAD/FMN-containing dehydrogenase
MKRIELDLKNCLVRAESGLTSGELDAATIPHGMVAPVGECPTTGIEGVTLGGGIGYLLGMCGLTCDNLVRTELIDARGEKHFASQREDGDLLWALRGGGGNFGVVTSLTYALHPIAEVLAGFFAYIAATPDEKMPRDVANQWVKGVRLALSSVSTGDAYVNGLFIGGEPDRNRVESGYGVNYSRLSALKRR